MPAAAQPVEVPRTSRADVVVERARAVLREDEHVVDARVHAVGQGEVDDPVLAAERDGRLGAVIGEDGEPLAGAAGQHDGNDVHRALPTAAVLTLPDARPDDRSERTCVKVHMVGGRGPMCEPVKRERGGTATAVPPR